MFIVILPMSKDLVVRVKCKNFTFKMQNKIISEIGPGPDLQNADIS